jgi:hypothetical protein
LPDFFPSGSAVSAASTPESRAARGDNCIGSPMTLEVPYPIVPETFGYDPTIANVVP